MSFTFYIIRLRQVVNILGRNLQIYNGRKKGTAAEIYFFIPLHQALGSQF